MAYVIEAGDGQRLGATPTADGVNFAVYSADAEAVELCLFAPDGGDEVARLSLPGRDGDVWHGFVPRLVTGMEYGFRAHGPYDPDRGLRFNPHKLLLDPYAHRITPNYRWGPEHYGYRVETGDDRIMDDRDNAAKMIRGIIARDLPEAPAGPNIPWGQTFIYETHVRGFTMKFPGLSDQERGTLAGLTRGPALDYLKALGVTAIELLPTHSFIDDDFLVAKGLRNYWGYNTLNYFTPHQPYTGPGEHLAFRDFVNAAHGAGLEVILDVVYNHTCEGNHLGPTLSYRGLDNRTYYRLQKDNPRLYDDITGCGATVNFESAAVRRLCIDSLRFWVRQMGIDGFRFDLAPPHGMTADGFSADAPFFHELRADPAFKNTKLFAEPWFVGPNGHLDGQFPADWAEWNGAARDAFRHYWRNDADSAGGFARALHGTADIYGKNGRGAWASVSFVSCHDGFPIADLVRYKTKHNEANGENNRDGTDHNLSVNYGTEGESDDPEVNRLRDRHQRNLLCCAYLHLGTPLLLGGDEFGRTQCGNNNTYAQDNETGWLDWSLAEAAGAQTLEFVRRLAAIRARHAVFAQADYLHGPSDQDPTYDILWLGLDGRAMEADAWKAGEGAAPFCMVLTDRCSGGPWHRVGRILAVFNPGEKPRHFTAPASPNGGPWQQILCTDSPAEASGVHQLAPGQQMTIPEQTIRLFEWGIDEHGAA